MLTLFTTAKPFQAHSAIIQRNALKLRDRRNVSHIV